ncbi:hypothetical protein PGT21_001125 [Puccinia graminis f. sp. tritici]|uniref:Uncharacterized protein n=1 Tax=Puccinia graminis f. sp. tritici TaxID=56615 RepID=A0A5B0PJV5_PUCGR|nr:hypothetical protein PGT21_001125 [Puccinia graminis f. sp. tritici]
MCLNDQIDLLATFLRLICQHQTSPLGHPEETSNLASSAPVASPASLYFWP